MTMDRVYDHAREHAAIEAVCGLFDEMGLTLFERWHVCHCIDMAATQVMGEGLKELRDSILEADKATLSSS